MNVAEKRKRYYEEVLRNFRYWHKYETDKISGQKESQPGEDENSILVLRKYLSTEEAIQAFERVLYDAMESLMLSTVEIFDGSGSTEDIQYALVDWDTKENLKPTVGQYSDDFREFLWEEEYE